MVLLVFFDNIYVEHLKKKLAFLMSYLILCTTCEQTLIRIRDVSHVEPWTVFPGSREQATESNVKMSYKGTSRVLPGYSTKL